MSPRVQTALNDLADSLPADSAQAMEARALSLYFQHAINIYDAHDVHLTAHNPSQPRARFLTIDQRVVLLQEAEAYFAKVCW
jgi:hypothetical protein